MHKTFAVVVGLWASGVMLAQTPAPDVPPVEYYFGAAASGVFNQPKLLHLSGPNLASNFSERASGRDGFEAAVVKNLGPHWGLKADVSYLLRDSSGNGTFNGIAQPFEVRSRALNLLFGPEWKWRSRSRFTPYVHTLVGVSVVRAHFTSSGAGVSVADADTRAGATLAVGGGLDSRVIGRLSLRTGADYMPAFLGSQLPGGPRVQQQLRLTIGVKFH
jgi:opacity protein-like surface antigen